MSANPIQASKMPSNRATRQQARALLGFFLCCIIALIVTFPMVANPARGQQQTGGKAPVGATHTSTSPISPVQPSPTGKDVALPYETQPAHEGVQPARRGGPDAYGYYFDDEHEPNGPVFVWHSIPTTSPTPTNRIPDSDDSNLTVGWQRSLADGRDDAAARRDDGVYTVTLPFDFNFYGANYRRMFISTNGNVNFGYPNDWYPRHFNNPCLPNSDPQIQIPKPMIAPDWFDFIIPNITDTLGGGVYTDTVGEAPNRRYFVEWRKVMKYQAPTSERVTFQLVLYETGEIRFQYNELPRANETDIKGIVGLHNRSGTIASQYSCPPDWYLVTDTTSPNRVVRFRIKEEATLNVIAPTQGTVPGDTIVFTPTLINHTGGSRTFTIDYAGNAWTTTVTPLTATPPITTSTTPITATLLNLAQFPLSVIVQVPLTTTIGMSDTTMLTAFSSEPSPYTVTLALTTIVDSTGVDFSLPNQVRPGAYDSTVNYTDSFINASPVLTNFTMTASYRWPTDISPSTFISVESHGRSTYNAAVQVPREAKLGDFDVLTVRADAPHLYFGVNIFTTTAGVWESKAGMAVPRSRAAAVMFPFPQNGHTYVIGGESERGSTNLPIDEYDPIGNSWSRRNTLLYGVSNVAGAAIGDAIFIPGGYRGALQGTTNALQVYYPLQDRVEIVTTDPLPEPRMGAGVTAYNNKLYVIGGSNDNLEGTKTVFEYDPARPAGARWHTKAEMPTGRVYLSAVTLDNVIYAVGGLPEEITELNTVEAYDPSTNSWTTRSPMNTGRAGFALMAVNSGEPGGCGGYMYALGGGWQSYTASGERYDPVNDRWGPLSGLTSPRRSLSGTYSPNTQALAAFGGWDGTYEGVTEAVPCSGDIQVPTPSPTATPCPINFSDVTTSDYFYTALQYLYCNGAVSGYEDRTFRPGENTTRAQLCKIVVLAQGWPVDTTGGPHFTDVPSTNVFYPFIETAYNHHVISGYANRTFGPNDNITRAQLCKIVVLSKSWGTNVTGGPHFTDVPMTDPFYEFVETAYNHGIISGYANRTFGPGNNATRAQISKIVHQAVTQP